MVRKNPIASAPAQQSMGDVAYRYLKQRIIEGELAPGAAVDEKQIAEMMGMSRTPVHEGVQRLEAEGFLAVLPRRGVHVRSLSPKDVGDIYDLLTALEVYAVVLLARRRPSPQELAPLQAAVDGMEAALAQGDQAGWIAADERFHRGLLTLCGNERIASTGLAHRDRVQRAHTIALRLRQQQGPAKSVNAHAALLALIAAGDVERARDAHLAQRERAGRELTDVITHAGLKAL